MQPILPRWLLVLLAALLLGFAFVASASSAGAAEVNKEHKQECLYNGMNKQVDWTNKEERRTAWCATQKWPVPGGFREFMAVGSCESGWYRFAYNPSGYVGLFQHDLGSWTYRVQHYEPQGWKLKDTWVNSRSQIVVTARMAHEVGWGPWSCA